MAMKSTRTANFPEKEEAKKIVLLDQATVNKRLADFKTARAACINVKNAPTVLSLFSNEEKRIFGMSDGKLKYVTDDDMLSKYDKVEAERKEDGSASYLSRDKLPLLESKTVAYLYGYNTAKTCTGTDLEVAAASMRGDPEGLQYIREYDDHVVEKMNEAFKVRDLSAISAMLLEVNLDPSGSGAIGDKMMSYCHGLLLVEAKIDPAAVSSIEARNMIAEVLTKYLGEVAVKLGKKMEVETKGKGYSIDEYCATLMELTKTFARQDDPFSDFGKGGVDKKFQPSEEKGAGRGGPGRGGGKGGRGGSKPTTASAETKPAYFEGICSHCAKKGHKKVDCRNLHLPAVIVGQGHGQGHGQNSGPGPSRKVALAWKNLTFEQFQEMHANQRK
jgi:hypothetical protein